MNELITEVIVEQPLARVCYKTVFAVFSDIIQSGTIICPFSVMLKHKCPLIRFWLGFFCMFCIFKFMSISCTVYGSLVGGNGLVKDLFAGRQHTKPLLNGRGSDLNDIFWMIAIDIYVE